MATFLTFTAGVCFAIGLSRIWRNQSLSLRAKAAWTLGLVAVLAVLNPLVNRPERTEPTTLIHTKGSANANGTTGRSQPKSKIDQPDSKASATHTSSILPSTLQPNPSPDLVDFPGTPSVIVAQEELLKVAELQSKADHAVIQQAVRRVVAAEYRPGGGWEQIDAQTMELSPDTKEAYKRWRSAVIAATPPKFSFETVKAMTVSSPGFASREAISAKQTLLNTADKLGITDQSLTKDVLNNIEKGKYEWADADSVMQSVQSETRQAYRRWKAAVISSK